MAITRCGNFYGGGDLNWNRIVPGTIRSITRGERPVIRSDGQYVRDYFYVEDGAAAYMLLAERLVSDPQIKAWRLTFPMKFKLRFLIWWAGFWSRWGRLWNRISATKLRTKSGISI